MTTTDEMIMRLRGRLGRTEADARKARDLLAEFRQREFDGVPPEEVAAARDLANQGEEVAGILRERLAELEVRSDHARELDDTAEALRDRIRQLEEEKRNRETANAAAVQYRAFSEGPQSTGPIPPGVGGARTRPRSLPYHERSQHSFFRDLAGTVRGEYDPEARRRLDEYAQEARAVSRTDGFGGDLVPPAWLGDVVEFPRAGRVTLDLCRPASLPQGTDEIRLPKIATGTVTAAQTADNAAVSSVDLTTEFVSAPIRTVAGQQDASLQLIEQSPWHSDQIIARDLLADLDQKLDVQLLYGTNANGQIQGLTTTAGIGAVVFSTGTVQALASKVAQAASLISAAVFAQPRAVVMHSRRWLDVLSAVDSNGRPLVVPTVNGTEIENGTGHATGIGGEGQVGVFAGLPVYLDNNITTNNGTGTDEDHILVLDTSQVRVWESGPRVRILPEVGSGTLTVRLQAYEFIGALMRQPGALSLVSGAGLATPTF